MSFLFFIMSLYDQIKLITSGQVSLGKRCSKPNISRDWEICLLLQECSTKKSIHTTTKTTISKQTVNLVKQKLVKSLFKVVKVCILL